ncbi:uncharacterized protein EV420DRAFT_940382 [Desarmillaria tabescens]|uniref:Uncharacterized protein n=1 Tax=Armillaria tabescens TaxID=1929756 RepID=A0AA39NGB9_ARMTA|nr:uncharacterized protein EV420DRAFT_940382 [Desarmillaria tabescens]KAK0465123.1 hypothetical protein EV420DRAFT_940382 [Desarmillaria tabescens]
MASQSSQSSSPSASLPFPALAPITAHELQYPDRPSSQPKQCSASRMIVHPYARLYAKKEEGKRRKIWNHALEKSLFNAYELSTLGAPHRRTIYMASLEAHIDRLHAQLLSLGFWPVSFDELEPFKGLNSKTAKVRSFYLTMQHQVTLSPDFQSMVSGLQYDASIAKLKLLELERAVSLDFRRLNFVVLMPCGRRTML